MRYPHRNAHYTNKLCLFIVLQDFKQTQQSRISRKLSHSCLVTPEDAKAHGMIKTKSQFLLFNCFALHASQQNLSIVACMGFIKGFAL